MRCFGLACLLALGTAPAAFALPTIPANLLPAVPEKEYDDFRKAFEGTKAKCDMCHTPGADKKAKGHGLNDYGSALHKHFDDKGFKAALKEEKKANAVKLLKEAIDKAAPEKNAAGETFGDLLKQGKLPGTNPPAP